MKKHLKSIICIMMALIASFSVFAAGCNQAETFTDPNLDRQLRYRTFEGTHDYTSPDVETEDYLVKDGKSDYVLVLPEVSTEWEKKAKNEFLLLFKRATGVTLPTRVDTELTDGTKFISIGQTAQWGSLNVTQEELLKLGSDGVRIVTKDNNIYLYGGEVGYWEKKQGVLYSVYTFMEIYFNYDYFYRNCITLDTGITELKLKNFNVWDIPDIAGRPHHGSDDTPSYDALRWYEADAGLTSQDTAYRLWRSRSEDYSLTMNTWTTFGDYSSPSAGMHNTSELVSPKSEGVNPKWFSDAGDQLCYTAHGDQQAYEDLVEYICKKFVMTMKYFNPTDYPTRYYLPIMQEDNLAFCNCPSCIDFNGANNDSVASGMIKLCNDAITKIREWQDDPTHEVYPYRRDNLKIVFFCYNSSMRAPAVWDADQQKYVPTSADVTPNEHVVGWVCPNWSYINDIYNPSNDRRRQECDAWGDLLQETWYWYYSASYQYDPYFKEAYNILNNNSFQWMASMNSHHSFDNISADGSDPTAFRLLELYLWTKLSWDSSIDSEVLTRKFFDAMYAGVADDMYEIFQMFIDHANLLALHNDWGGAYNRPKFWSYNGFLKPVNDKFEAILAKVDALYGATDPAYAELVKSRVCVEYVAPLYYTLFLYGQSASTAPFTEDVRQSYKDKFRTIHERYFPANTLNGQGSAMDFVNGLA